MIVLIGTPMSRFLLFMIICALNDSLPAATLEIFSDFFLRDILTCVYFYVA